VENERIISKDVSTENERINGKDASAENERIIGAAGSICPVCLRRIDAVKIRAGDDVYLQKTCPEHGGFRTLIWEGPPDYESWGGGAAAGRTDAAAAVEVRTGAATEVQADIAAETPTNAAVCNADTASRISPVGESDTNCPDNCGLCENHGSSTCCSLIEVTERCGLRCPVCFASSSESGADPTLNEIAFMYDALMSRGGKANVQLSGGEPTLRDDLPEIIRVGRDKGFDFFQLNTNGLRLADDLGYSRSLRDAGLSCVFLQFDGVSDGAYTALRGQPLLRRKLTALDNCAAAGLPVTLVPVLEPGVNVSEIGELISFAINRLPYVRGVHFQPVSYFGRCGTPPERRLTLPRVLREIEAQTDGVFPVSAFSGGTAENAYCSFSGSFLINGDGSVQPLKNPPVRCCRDRGSDPAAYGSDLAACGSDLAAYGRDCGGSGLAACGSDPAARERDIVARRWGVNLNSAATPSKPGSMDAFLEYARLYTFSVSGMCFQDAWTLETGRLRGCHIHVVSPDGRLIPFCAYNLTDTGGRAKYRTKRG